MGISPRSVKIFRWRTDHIAIPGSGVTLALHLEGPEGTRLRARVEEVLGPKTNGSSGAVVGRGFSARGARKSPAARHPLLSGPVRCLNSLLLARASVSCSVDGGGHHESTRSNDHTATDLPPRYITGHRQPADEGNGLWDPHRPRPSRQASRHADRQRFWPWRSESRSETRRTSRHTKR